MNVTTIRNLAIAGTYGRMGFLSALRPERLLESLATHLSVRLNDVLDLAADVLDLRDKLVVAPLSLRRALPDGVGLISSALHHGRPGSIGIEVNPLLGRHGDSSR